MNRKQVSRTYRSFGITLSRAEAKRTAASLRAISYADLRGRSRDELCRIWAQGDAAECRAESRAAVREEAALY